MSAMEERRVATDEGDTHETTRNLRAAHRHRRGRQAVATQPRRFVVGVTSCALVRCRSRSRGVQTEGPGDYSFGVTGEELLLVLPESLQGVCARPEVPSCCSSNTIVTSRLRL